MFHLKYLLIFICLALKSSFSLADGLAGSDIILPTTDKLQYRVLIHPTFKAAGNIDLSGSSGFSALLSQGKDENYYYRFYAQPNGKLADDLTFYKDLKFPHEFSLMNNPYNVYYVGDAIIDTGEFIKNPENLSNTTDCRQRVFEAGDSLLFGQVNYTISLSETYMCIRTAISNPEGSIDTIAMNGITFNDEMNVYQITSIFTGPSTGEKEKEFHIIDEAGNDFKIKWLFEDRLREPFKITSAENLGVLSLDEFNDKQKISPLKYNEKRYGSLKISDNYIRDWKIHFNHSFVESITYFQSNLYYSRGLRLAGDYSVRLIGNGEKLMIPSNLLTTKQIRYSVQAMELYEYENKTYLHMAGVQWNNGKADYFPFYYHCKFDSNQQNSIKDQRFGFNSTNCQMTKMPELIMPIDFVYYNSSSCKKLIVIYQYMMRVFEPNDNLIKLGRDYKSRPFKAHGWTDKHIRAAMFYNERFYVFSTGNRLFIERDAHSSANCANISLSREDQFDMYYGSDLILNYQEKSNQLDYERPANVYDGLRYAIPSNQTKELVWSEALQAIPNDHLLVGPKGPGGGGFMSIVIVCFILIAIAIIAAWCYCYCCSSGEKNPIPQPQGAGNNGQMRPRNNIGPVTSGITSQLTARSSLTPPTSNVDQTRKTPRSPMSPKSKMSKTKSKAQSPKTKTMTKSRSKSPASPVQRRTSSKSISPIKSRKN